MNRPYLSFAPATIAAVCCGIAAVGFAAVLDGYSHLQHPLALLGARDIPRAMGFNLLGFIVPGLLVAWSAAGLRRRLPPDAGLAARVGARLWLLSALAFAAQGVWPLDPQDIDGPHSQRHATVWTLWWIAFVPGALLLALGLRRAPGRAFAVQAAFVSGALVLVLAALPALFLPGPVAQRIAIAAWFAGYIATARR